MTERVIRVHPTSKPNGIGSGSGSGSVGGTTVKNPKLPPPLPTTMKSQLNNQNRHPYRPNLTNYHRKRRSGFRRCFCLSCFWSILVIIILLLLAAICGCVLYLLYHPQPPTFSVTSLKISQFNLSTASDGTTHLTSNLNLTMSTKNPNGKITFHYDPIAIACLSEKTEIANGSFSNSFTSDPNNITIIRSSLRTTSQLLDTDAVDRMRSDLKKKSGLPLQILLDTQATMKIESIKSKKVGIRIKCEGIRSMIPKIGGGKANRSSSPVAATVSDAKCEVDLRIKIWKWSV